MYVRERGIFFHIFLQTAKFSLFFRHARAAALIYCHEINGCGGRQMDNKTQKVIERFKKDPAAAQSLLQSGDGQSLMQLLTAQDGGAALEQAAQSAARGDTKELAAMTEDAMMGTIRKKGGIMLFNISPNILCCWLYSPLGAGSISNSF